MSLAAAFDDMRAELSELGRRLANLIQQGRIEAVDPEHGVCRFRCGDLVTGWVRWMAPRAGADREWWCPTVDEQAILFSPDGEPNQGWVLPAVYCGAFPQPDADPNRHVVTYNDGMRIVHEPGRLVLDGWDAEGTVEIRAKNVVIKTGDGGFFHLDHTGMATRTTHKGGNRFESEKWVAGSVVVDKGDQGFHPPEVEA